MPAELFDEMEAIYAPPDHSVFELVPPLFHERADRCYTEAGRPVVTSDNFWDIFRDVLARFRAALDEEQHDELTTLLSARSEHESAENEDNMPVLANMKPFRQGQQVAGRGGRYIGGLPASSLASSTTTTTAEGPEFADFTSDEEDNEEDEDGLL